MSKNMSGLMEALSIRSQSQSGAGRAKLLQILASENSVGPKINSTDRNSDKGYETGSRGSFNKNRGSQSSIDTSSKTRSSADSMNQRFSSQDSSPLSEEPQMNLNLEKGMSGDKIPVTVGYFKLNIIHQNKGIHLYGVSFKPAIESKRLKMEVVNNARGLGSVKQFCGSVLYTIDKIHSSDLTQFVVIRDMEIEVIFHYKNLKHYGDNALVHLYNVLFNQVCCELKLIRSRNNYYNQAAAVPFHQHSLEVWPGYVLTTNSYGEHGVLLQCDVSSRILRTKTIYECIRDLNNERNRFSTRSNDFGIKDLIKKMMIGHIALTKYNNKTYRIDDFEFEKCPEDSFEMSDGKKIRFYQYYERMYNITIRDRKQPLLVHFPKADRGPRSDGVIHKKEPIYLIPELCFITGLTDVMKKNNALMKNVRDHIMLGPKQRRENTLKFVNSVKRNESASRILSNWGLQLSRDTLKFDARVLHPMKLLSSKSSTFLTQSDFSREISSRYVFTPIEVTNCILLCQQTDKICAKQFIDNWISVGKQLGIKVNPPKFVTLQSSRTEEHVSQLKKELTPSTNLVVSILSSQKTDLYTAIKKICCRERPVPSQVIISNTLKKAKGIVSKIAMQINCKLGGELWASNPCYNVVIAENIAYSGFNSFVTLPIKWTII